MKKIYLWFAFFCMINAGICLHASNQTDNNFNMHQAPVHLNNQIQSHNEQTEITVRKVRVFPGKIFEIVFSDGTRSRRFGANSQSQLQQTKSILN
ncbi:MAG TPA: hypothetical protein VLG50_00230 [Candidatus Saccharimonadales bacterium]|nr:hypothetical protein [Candidatus Saccharimonadales bacterium]